jgi:phosphopantetheine adenylyltransferase
MEVILGNFIYTPQTVLFSGRFDPPTPSHIVQILRLLKRYQKVLVVMLDYPKRRFPLRYCLDLFNETFENRPVEIITNTKHFGKISAEEITKYSFDVYAAGNLQVLRHIESLGFPVIYIERAFAYTASDIPLPK